jgi:3-hydroxy acid dehydrogenase / malonic semialdehyde reductase
MPSIRLDGETAYITGASAGIGEACALQLAQAGANVFLGARRVERLVDVKRRIEAAVPGAAVKVGTLDVTDDASVTDWLAQGDAMGPCSILVNNAGLAVGRASVVDSKQADWDTMLDVNVRAAFSMVRRVLPTMMQRGHGDVVMMGSVAGSEPYGNGALYCATKAAVHAFSRALRAELLGSDVRVLCFDPGMVETEFSIVRTRGDAEAAKKVYAGMRPLTAEDVADCVVFALTRPRHVSLDRMLILSQDQLGTQTVHRR